MRIPGKIFMLFIMLIASLTTMAQGASKEPQMADLMRSNGRIYVVVVVLLTILIGLLFYVFRLDRKISKLEKENR
jgi:CcmD family protein